MLLKVARRPQYNENPKEILNLALINDKNQLRKERIARLREFVDLGDKAKDVEEILDVFLDRTENKVLEMMKKSADPNTLLRTRMYYMACLSLSAEIKNIINEALVKNKTLQELQRELKEDK